MLPVLSLNIIRRISTMLLILTVFLLGMPITSVSAHDSEISTSLSSKNSVDTKPHVETQFSRTGDKINVFSWNVSGDAFVKDPEVFKALVTKAEANILLLDEVSPLTNESQIHKALPGMTLDKGNDWHINFGTSGGRQRNVIISRLPQENLPEFSKIIPYPEFEKERIRDRMIAAGKQKHSYGLDDGLAVNGVIIIDGENRLLAVSSDLECCGNDPGSWQEDKRRMEAREIRRLIGKVIERTQVDGIILAGDLNLVSTVLPLIILSGPYKKPHSGLIAADLRHLDGKETWTWDGRGTPFPSRVMDLVIYSPNTIHLSDGYILDPEDLSPEESKQMGIRPETFSELSEHLALSG